MGASLLWVGWFGFNAGCARPLSTPTLNLELWIFMGASLLWVGWFGFNAGFARPLSTPNHDPLNFEPLTQNPEPETLNFESSILNPQT